MTAADDFFVTLVALISRPCASSPLLYRYYQRMTAVDHAFYYHFDRTAVKLLFPYVTTTSEIAFDLAIGNIGYRSFFFCRE